MHRSILLAIAAIILSSSSTVAQDYAASTAPASITSYKQLESNLATVPSFPCDEQSPPYTSLDLGSTEIMQQLSELIADVFEYYLYSTYPLTSCSINDVPVAPIVQVSSACKNSKAGGADYALEVNLQYTCVGKSTAKACTDLKATLYVPASAGDLSGAVIKDIWLGDFKALAGAA